MVEKPTILYICSSFANHLNKMIHLLIYLHAAPHSSCVLYPGFSSSVHTFKATAVYMQYESFSSSLKTHLFSRPLHFHNFFDLYVVGSGLHPANSTNIIYAQKSVIEMKTHVHVCKPQEYNWRIVQISTTWLQPSWFRLRLSVQRMLIFKNISFQNRDWVGWGLVCGEGRVVRGGGVF